ncbi:hypothetical protein [Halomicronema sp. CCY15110]|uniref:hypothetical protein n=1 Tax=Halomicronema sp. CCY15110 TaxID=2767773 RepID=UPI00194FA347
MSLPMPPILHSLPDSLPMEGAISVVLEAGVPIFRASQTVQQRIEALLDKQENETLTSEELAELDRYAEIDDYLSFVNRTLRNLYQRPPQTAA